jgi:D-glycero-D-manno-heptose 1,7-bisphosphate phosphatase
VGSLKRCAVFVDRDGTLSLRPPEHEYVTRLEDFVWLPDAPEALCRLSRAGYVVAVVSNQRGVARGLVSRSVLRQIERRIQEELSTRGCRVEAFRYCFHDLAEACECRKPRPGMLLGLAQELDLDLSHSWMIGDAASDIEAGRAAGCRTAFVGTPEAGVGADICAPSLDQVSRTITTRASSPSAV